MYVRRPRGDDSRAHLAVTRAVRRNNIIWIDWMIFRQKLVQRQRPRPSRYQRGYNVGAGIPRAYFARILDIVMT